MSDVRVGFIGLGAIGVPMAVHVAKAFDAVVWNRTTDKARAFGEEHGVEVAESAGALVKECDVVITCLSTSDDVLDVLDGIGDVWRKGQLLVDATSGDPTGSKTAAARLEKFGAGFVDAPVSGGTSGAEAGTLTSMLGGEEPWVSKAREIVSCYSKKIEHVGPVGAGHALKAINQGLLAINIVAAAEGFAALTKLGVTPSVALNVINSATGRSNVTENLFPQRVITGDWPRTFKLSLLDKDLGVALKVLEDTGIPSGAIRVAKDEYAKARKALGEEADHVEYVRDFEKRVGVEVRG